jgi:hypothetical protein
VRLIPLIFIYYGYLFVGSETQTDSFFWHNLLEKALYKFGHGLSQSQLLVRPPKDLTVPFITTPAEEDKDVDWYAGVKTYLEQQAFLLIQIQRIRIFLLDSNSIYIKTFIVFGQEFISSYCLLKI